MFIELKFRLWVYFVNQTSNIIDIFGSFTWHLVFVHFKWFLFFNLFLVVINSVFLLLLIFDIRFILLHFIIIVLINQNVSRSHQDSSINWQVFCQLVHQIDKILQTSTSNQTQKHPHFRLNKLSSLHSHALFSEQTLGNNPYIHNSSISPRVKQWTHWACFNVNRKGR